jgi:predicted phage tail protein
MRMRLVVGVLLCLVGAVWFLQGIDVLGGSGMSGQAFWAVAGAVLVVVGVAQLMRAQRSRTSSRQ